MKVFPPRQNCEEYIYNCIHNTEVCSLQQGCPLEPANSSLRKSVHNDIPYYATLVLMLITQVIKGT